MLGKRIKEMRAANHINQIDLAKKLSISKQALSNWENDNSLPPIEMLQRLAKYLCCTSDFLLELDDSRKILDVTDLTLEQTAHLQTVANDYREMNRLLREAKAEKPEEPKKFKFAE